MLRKRLRIYYESGTVAHTVCQWRHTRSAGLRAAGRRSCMSWRPWIRRRSLHMQQRLPESAGGRQGRHLESMRSHPSIDTIRIYSKNNPAIFHSDSIWNDGTPGFFVTASSQQEEKVELDDWVPDPKMPINKTGKSEATLGVRHKTQQLAGYKLASKSKTLP